MSVSDAYKEDFSVLSSRERLLYLIELGRDVPDCTSFVGEKISGCTSDVRIAISDSSVRVCANSKVVKGFVKIILDLVESKEIASLDVASFLESTGLGTATEMSRSDAFLNVFGAVKESFFKLRSS